MGASKYDSVFNAEKLRMMGDQLSKMSPNSQSDAELSTYASYSPESPSKAARDARSRYFSQGISAPASFPLMKDEFEQ